MDETYPYSLPDSHTPYISRKLTPGKGPQCCIHLTHNSRQGTRCCIYVTHNSRQGTRCCIHVTHNSRQGTPCCIHVTHISRQGTPCCIHVTLNPQVPCSSHREHVPVRSIRQRRKSRAHTKFESWRSLVSVTYIVFDRYMSCHDGCVFSQYIE